MIVRTCLLISDDPDDQIEFSEALNEISDDTVLVTVSDFKKAVSLLTQKKCIPDFIFLNLTAPGLAPDEFLETLEIDNVFNNVRIMAYGDSLPVHSPRIGRLIHTDLSYSDLKEILREEIGRR